MSAGNSPIIFRKISKTNNSTVSAVDTNVSIDPVSKKESETGNKNESENESGSEDDTSNQIKYGTNYQAAWGIFSEYCDNSTIHGIKYLGEQKRPLLERVFWIFVFVLLIYICTTLTVSIYERWTYNPVIVSFAEKSTPVWEIPFPAVTICKERKFDQNTFNYTRTLANLKYDNLTIEEVYYLEAISQVCYRDDLENSVFGKEIVSAPDLVATMEKAMNRTNPCWRIKWRSKKTTCKRFQKVLTEEGLCYTFNNLKPIDIYQDEALIDDDEERDEDEDEHHNGDDNYLLNETVEWNLQNGYNPDAETDAFPYRVLRNGAKAGLFLELEDDYDDNTRCEARVPGFKISLHTPGEVPRVSEQYISIPFNQVVLLLIKPEIITTSENLKHYQPMRRHCFFQNERVLRFFKVYTQNNCKLECLSNFTMKHCGCVKFSMPRTLNTPVCGAAKIGCMMEAEDFLSKKEFRQSSKKTDENYSGETSCNCLPGCTSISYNAEISQGHIDLVGVVRQVSRTRLSKSTYFKYEWSEVSIYFKEAQFLTSKRSELHGMTDFLANCGGLLGLFMGVSTLSIVELVYFCTVRLMTNLKLRRKKHVERIRLEREAAMKLIADKDEAHE